MRSIAPTIAGATKRTAGTLLSAKVVIAPIVMARTGPTPAAVDAQPRSSTGASWASRDDAAVTISEVGICASSQTIAKAATLWTPPRSAKQASIAMPPVTSSRRRSIPRRTAKSPTWPITGRLTIDTAHPQPTISE